MAADQANQATAAPGEGGRVHGGELPALLLSFLYFFCVLAAYYMIRPVREQLAAAVGSTYLPWFYGATFVVMLLLAPLFGALVARWPRRIAVPLVNLVFIACLLGFVPLFAAPVLSPKVLGTVFFVWVSVFNLFVVSVFWSFMSDIWVPAQARRLFPIIAVAGTAGAVAGTQMSDMKLQNTDTTNRLNTLTHTKNTVPSNFGDSTGAANRGTKPSRQAMKNRFTSGTAIRRGQRDTSAPNNGASSNITTKVAP